MHDLTEYLKPYRNDLSKMFQGTTVHHAYSHKAIQTVKMHKTSEIMDVGQDNDDTSKKSTFLVKKIFSCK